MELLTTLALVATLTIPGNGNAHVSLAAEGRTVVAAWSAATAAGQQNVYLAVSRDSGATFGSAVRVNSTEGDAKINGEQPPRVVLIHGRDQPAIVVVWPSVGKSGSTLLTARSDDGGKTFSRSTPVTGSEAPGNRGWQSAAADGHGAVHALWLDHRGMAAAAGTAGSAGHMHGHTAAEVKPAAKTAADADGTAAAQKSALYTAVVGQPDSVRAITTSVCYCCKTAIAAAPDGTLFAAWRHVYPGSIRDIAATVSKDGGKTFAPPVKVSDDRWVLNGCPDDGPAIAIDAQSRLHIVWPTVVTAPGGAQTLALFYATSNDGRSFTPRQPVPTQGVPHHPQIAAMPDGRVVVGWDETAKSGRQVVFAQAASDASGKVTFTRNTTATPGTYPVLASTPDGVVAAWTSGSGAESAVRVERVQPR